MTGKHTPRKAVRRQTASQQARPPVVCLVSLGCAKNTVDSERILGRLVSSGFLVAEQPSDADICLVNTCGFIADARQETREVLEELAQLRECGTLHAVLALGCMVERAARVPEQSDILTAADGVVSFMDYDRLDEICRAWIPGATGDLSPTAPFHQAPRLRLGTPHLAGLKIAEGCSNRCRFCTIPSIRGPQISRTVEAVVQEARELITAGARELDLIAQDTSGYGRDLYGERSLPRLLRALSELDFDGWLRLLYAHPAHLSDEMLDVLAADPRFCPYLDMPLQHISDPVLRAMGRTPDSTALRRLLDRVHNRWPQAALRTTFIVGFPGETEAQFDELAQFLGEGRFRHVGVFTYSPEPQTPAGMLPDVIPPEIKQQRRDHLMEIQREISRKYMAQQVGAITTVMLDEKLDRRTWQGRTAGQAPEVDGVVFVEGLRGPAQPGDFRRVRFTAGLDYDAVAEPVKERG